MAAGTRQWSVAGDFPSRHIQMAFRVQHPGRHTARQPLVRLQVGTSVRQGHVVVAVRQQRIAQVAKTLGSWRLKWSAKIRSNAARVSGFVFVMPVRVVRSPAVCDLFCRQAKQEEVFLARPPAYHLAKSSSSSSTTWPPPSTPTRRWRGRIKVVFLPEYCATRPSG